MKTIEVEIPEDKEVDGFYPVTSKVDQEFWLTLDPIGRACATPCDLLYHSEEAALKQAKRLATMDRGRTIFVLKATQKVTGKTVVIENKELKS